jgi:hypothetical protein
MSETPEHLLSPFTITAKGAKTVEQDTPADIANCVFNTAVCTENYREDEPLFGVPELAFQTVPLDLATYEAAIEQWEPRAEIESSEMEAGIAQARRVNIEIEPS